MSRDFYVHLRGTNENGNSPCRFLTNLSEPISLSGKWEMSLQEIAYDNRIETIVDEEVRVYSSSLPTRQLILLEQITSVMTEGRYVIVRHETSGDTFLDVKEEELTKNNIEYPLRFVSIPLVGEKKGEDLPIGSGEDGVVVPPLSEKFRYELWGYQTVTKADTYKDYKIPPGQYSTEEQLLTTINKTMDKEEKVLFSLDPHQHFQLTKLPTGKRVELLHGLEGVLGFRNHLLDRVGLRAENRATLTRGAFAMHVYCNLLDPILVESTREPLLRVIPLQQSEQNLFHYTFQPPYYLPMGPHYFQNIAMNIQTEKGEEFPFAAHARVFLTLHFRPCQ